MRQLVVLLALSLLAVPAQAQSQAPIDSPVTDLGDFRAEPDGAQGPALVDDNGIGPALAGDLSLILNSKWVASPATGATVGTTDSDLNTLFDPLVADDMIVPGVVGTFHAWYGEWADHNGDGHVPSGSFTSAFTSFNYAGSTVSGRECSDGSFGLGPIPTVTTPGAALGDCASDTAGEWESDPAAVIVSYVTPGRAQRLDLQPDGSPRDPALNYVYITGYAHYVASLEGFVFVDNSVLQTTAVETLANPTVAASGLRSRVPTTGEPIDVDVYRAVDPTVEQLYAAVTASLAPTGCEVDRPLEPVEGENDCVAPIPDAPSSAAVVGPVAAIVLPPVASEATQDHAAAPHLYFDVRLVLSGNAPPANGPGIRGDSALTADGGNAGVLAPAADGRAAAPAYASVAGFLGAWHDVNGDGFIGAPTAEAGCVDAYDCGLSSDPNTYSAEEWTPFCRATDRPNGEILATLTSSTGSWGSGVYVVTDREFFGFSLIGDDTDWYEEPGNGGAKASPYDDAALDLQDGDVDALRTSGPIDFHINCDAATTGPGEYHSFEDFLFLDGGNRGYGITLATVAFSAAFQDAGIDTEETVADTDVIAAL